MHKILIDEIKDILIIRKKDIYIKKRILTLKDEIDETDKNIIG